MKTKITKNGLSPLPEDTRDFPLGAVFGTMSLDEVPNTDFDVATPLVIKDQGADTDYCSGYAVTEVSEDQEEVELLAEYQFFVTKKMSGDPEAWGSDLRTACKSTVKYGSLPAKGFEHMREKHRSEILTDASWSRSVHQIAATRKKETFFSVVGSQDTFDNIRTALWQHRKDKSTVITGAIWRNGWLEAEGGVIPEEYGQGGFGHAFKFFGQKKINGKLYLKAQLSQGTGVGDGGIFYFSRAVTNREIGKFGIYMLKDLPRAVAEKYINSPFTMNTPRYKVVLTNLANFFKKYV